MKTRLVVPLVGLAISFALPTYAQQKDVADPQTTQKVFASFKAWDEANNNNDAAAVAAFFTRNAGQAENGELIPIKGYWSCIYVRATIGRYGWGSLTQPRTVLCASTRVLHHNRPQRLP
jgi:hypothetical protein